jgi:RimJ/RimL family protein N-acetyltransferase
LTAVDVPVIETPRLRLREWRWEDIDVMARIYADPEVERQLERKSREDTEGEVAYLAAHWEHEGFGAWAAEERETGRFIGRIGLLRHVDWPADPVEVGWTLDPAVWRRGLATEGGAASLRYGFEALGLDRILSVTLPDNARSRRVMEKLGLTHRGRRFWRDLDHVWYAIDLEEWERR